ncbi:hypothetical protein MSG28_016087 [Choristoneura fumiferana]|uniref:Uncharacterized protein n=1 Tax=Choristoneura fumiferana TaxID=7141 RepID=A0ACC0K591_CHOFU|nr:hypothetical protein MSG28_016087 [Choristoneura fumiferana]
MSLQPSMLAEPRVDLTEQVIQQETTSSATFSSSSSSTERESHPRRRVILSKLDISPRVATRWTDDIVRVAGNRWMQVANCRSRRPLSS